MGYKKGTVSLRIKDIMSKNGITQKMLQNSLGITQATISYIVNGKTNPSLDTLQKIASALDVPIWQLFVAPDDVRSTGAMPSATGFVALIKNGSDMYSAASIDEAKDVLKRIEETQQNSPDDANQHENRTDL